jgi:hypothetical protein
MTSEAGIFAYKWMDYVNTDGEYLYYFWSGVRQDNADSGLYRTRADGSEDVLILQTEELFSPNIAGGKIFWHNNDDQRRLTVMNLDGSEMTFVEQAHNSSGAATPCGYYTEKTRLCMPRQRCR